MRWKANLFESTVYNSRAAAGVSVQTLLNLRTPGIAVLLTARNKLRNIMLCQGASAILFLSFVRIFLVFWIFLILLP